MGNSNFKPRNLIEWSEPCNNFINLYLAKKQEVLECSNDLVWEEYICLKNNNALLYLNKMNILLQKSIFELVLTPPNFDDNYITKCQQSLRMIECLYEQNFLEFINKYENEIDTTNINLKYDVNIILNIKFISYPSFINYEINI